MKKTILFALSLIMFSVTMWADDRLNRVNPNEASYKIEGDFSYRIVDNKVQYELTNVKPKGIQIKPQDVYLGFQIDGKEVMFTFDSIVTPDNFPGFDNISYWYYDPDISDWQPDIEIRKGENTVDDRRDITMMLIIDCSNSLKSDFAMVKNATSRFLKQMYDAAPNGNVHIGIIGFSSIPDTKILPIQPLNATTFISMQSFIRNLTVNNGTALFYAWDKAMDATVRYIQSGKMHQYEKSHFITFTDGIDQTSQDINRPNPIVNADEYYNFIIKTAKKQISNYESDVVFVTGIDITNKQQQIKFENKLKQLAVPNDNLHYERLESISRLEAKFSEIANRLTDSWQVLNCYVAPARHGRVCWTFGKKEKTIVKKEKPKVINEKTMLLGLSLGIGIPIYNQYYKYTSRDYPYTPSELYSDALGGDFQFSIDFAYPITQKFALGLYLNGGFGLAKLKYYDTRDNPDCIYTTKDVVSWNGTAGVLMAFGDMSNKGAFILGIGSGLGDEGGGYSLNWSHTDAWNIYIGNHTPLEVRLGGVFKKGFYFSIDVYTIPETWNSNEFFIEPAVRFGYNFGSLIKVK